ncbi:uncharacterized protein Dsimw501_GD13415, isoform H [Drosophila simulans]|uniref:Uncharacterized protein, isoform H n=1 Tax=Drosophila simulans TaxID=7240 RepID=A0A0J9UCN4_DROSI|nr:uncharacterized protein Dsimw501_GD13415, isoform H [Drosophila simulans]
MQRQNPNPYQQQNQQHQQVQQFSSQEYSHSSQEQHQEQRISRTEQHVQRSQVTTQRQVQQHHGGSIGGAYVPPSLTHVYAQGDISPPVFEQIFKNARFAQGGNALFEGRLRGNPKPFVTWTRKGAPLLESQKFRMSYNEATGDVSLLINQIGPGDEGEYTCTARNQYGEAICSVYIQPEGAPMPALQPIQNLEKNIYSNGYSYTSIEEEFRVDTFEYRLLREVSFREAITRRSGYEQDSQLSQELDRNQGPAQAPQISQKPRSSKLIEGSDAVFTARVGSNPKPRLTWFHNGQRLVASQKYEISYSSGVATLRVKNATARDGGHYTLLAENLQGCVVSSAVLAVEPAAETAYEPKPVDVMAEQLEAGKALPPAFVKAFGDREITEGRMTRFDCRVTGNPYPEVFWLINGRQVRDDASHKILVNESGSHSLMITNVTRLDAGAVQCLARNKAGEVAIEAQLNVLEKEQVVAPQFVQRFSTMTVREGEPITMSANAIGTPQPRITWQKDGVQISSTADRFVGIDGGATCLEIPRVTANDAGWYQCTAQNIAGSTANRARLYVEVPREQPSYEQRRLNLPRPTKVIEPEPIPGPEIIYLRHVERAKPHLRPGEEDRVYPPPQFIIPLQNVQQTEGGRVHMEARIEPVGDPTMVVEWYLNGRPLAASARATSVFKFGFIALDLLSIMGHDSGEYMCRVTNASGVAESRAILSVVQRPSIEQSSQNPNSLQYINQLEDYSRYQRTESIDEQLNQAPQFIRPLRDLGEFEEGKNVHFEAQVTPVNDPSMRVEWYKDGLPITASSRITAIFNFGYVSLNILHLRAEDAGTYTVRAVNRIGEAISQSSIRVHSRSQVTADLGIPEQQRYIEKVEELEDYRKSQQRRHVQEAAEAIAPPQFKTPIQNQLDLREHAHAHFEARLEPVGDSTMRVEWLKDGQPLEASSRITTYHNFGYVALTIKQLTIYDAGTYTCRAYNAMGQDTTVAQLTVISKNEIVSESQHPGGLQKIQHLEDSSRYGRREEEETYVTQAPRFLGPLKGTTKILEGQRAHFEARVEPQSDLGLVIEWYHNGRSITAANRIQTYYDFGYVALDISQVRAEDAGVYLVVARNKLGEAQQQATMIVETRSSIDTSSMHRGLYEKTQNLENKPFVEPQYDIEEISKSKPVFVTPLSDPKPIHDGKNIHLECRLEPMGDPTMRVEWFHNGRPVTVGSRFRTYYDFGFVALDIIKATAADSGEYTVRATNHLGTAHTSACVRVIDHTDVVTETQNEQSLEQIQLLEDSRRRHHQEEDITIMQAPQFTRGLHNIETIEGTNVHLECRLQPVGDPSMRIEWFVNGKPVKTGHRFRPAYEFDYVALDLLGCYAIDSGVYTCQARNQLGEAVTSCSVRIIAKNDLILETQNESGLQKIQYLEDSTRHRRSEFVDEVVNIRPRFLTHPKSLTNTREGGHAHFECKIEPVTDPNLKVEWFKNGRPITVGHRFRPIHDFGYVALDIVHLIAEDSGVYTCRAVNLIGSDETQVELQCRSGEQIVTVTQNEAGLEQIHYLEDRSRYTRREEIDESTKQAPVFTTSLKNVEIKENQRAHFECRLIPVSDPSMRVEWYHNNLPLKSGSRFTETNNFGFVALDIMSTLPEDAGTYTCRAYNAVGEAITSAVAVVHTKKSIYLESQHETALPRLQHLEDGSKRQRISVQDEFVSQAPVFTMPVRDVRVAENQAVHFEARLIPVGDPKLKVEWLRNGQPIEASNRTTTMHDFGYVALNMKYVNPEDSGTYTCRAVNELGQAVTSASLIVQSKTSIQLETQHEAAMHKIHQLEDHSRYQRREEEEYTVTTAPVFVTKLIGPSNLVEGQSAHYECRIEPYPDPNLKVEWFHNGKPLSTGHRFRTTYDFGFAALDILTVYAEDSGEYTCRVTNNLGEAINSIVLNVTSRSSIIHETQHEEALTKIQHLEDSSRFQRKTDEEQFHAERPQFGRPLRNAKVNEGAPVHLEATLIPVNDPTMKVEWYCNGRPIQTGHRFKTTYDFGFVALDILYAHAEDTGTYMCKAKNAIGEAVTTCAVNVTANKTLDLDTLDAQRLEKIRQLETYAPPPKPVVEEKGQKPIFLTPLSNLEHLKEGEHAHLECRVEPINDPNLKIEWFCNGKQLPTGHRYRTTHDFGYVALDILYVYGEDTGTYICKATNQLGEAVNTCNVRVLNRRSMILDTQHPDALEKIQKLESKVPNARTEVGDAPISPPHFTAELRGSTEIYEGQTAHFEAQVAPVHDPNLRIEFYHNGKPLPSASRFHITFDFGYVSLDITHAVAEDAGEYSVRAVNALGQAVSSTNLRVIPRGTIISDTQHPEGLEKIRKLESTAPHQRQEPETPGTRQRPVFTQPLQNIDRINEHQTAHFEARLIPVGDPNLKVEWYRNEKIIEDSSRITKQHDFGFVSLDISHIRKEDEGVYMCRAVNPLGEAVTTASMRVVSEASIQMDTQHPDSISRIHQLEKPLAPRPTEPERLFEKPIFTQLLTGPSELWEGAHAHFEARVVPVGDPSLKFEWFINGVELQMGSRLRTTHDFGFVTLDITAVVPEDAGVYMCRAYNAAGEAVSSTAMKVKTKSNIDGQPLIPESWEAIRLKEAAMNRVPEMFVDSTPQQAPVFTTHLQSYDKLHEGQHVLLEAQVEPRADPNLRIEWFKNGISLTTGSRIRSTFDFGLVTLSINGLRADDSAIYTCKATNQVGEAVSTSSLKIEDRHWLQAESLHPDSLPRIGELEAPKEGRPEAPEPTYETPVFITHLNNIECKESDNVRFECNVEPARDPTMSIEWFYNGQPLQAAAKFKSIYDFGYCALDLTNSYAENSGVYTCKATNSKGSATTSGTLKCTGGKTMFLDTQHPQGEAGLEAVQETEEELANRYTSKTAKPETQYPPPVWTKPLQAEFHLSEAQPIHLEANVEPKEDPNLFIEWYFNGKMLNHGSRFKMTSEFGFVTMDMIEVYARDQGIYTCKAYNKAGEAFTSTTIFCSSKENIIESTQHPKGAEGLEQIQDLEDSLRKDGSKPEQPDLGIPPRFTTEFVNIADIGEGELAHFEANLIPVGDQSMVIEWFYNGKVLEASHRVRTIYAFGTVALEVLGTKIEDTGTYTCRATNKHGTAEISCNLECVDKPRGQKPRFTSHIQPLEGLKDGQSAHFECTLIPVNDPDLKVEWYHNGKLMRHSNRIKTVSDFGYVVLDISYLQDHDSGEYVCRAWNKYGEDFTRTTLNCGGRGGVFYDSLQPDSLQRIRELECPQGQQADTSAPLVAEPPKFITQIVDVTKLVEGQSAHFEARLTPITDPDLVVEWYFNGKKLPHGHRFRTFHDFGIVILDILYCYEENSGVYEARARNKYGEDVTRASLKCASKSSLILDSQLPRGMEGGLEKIANLEYSMVRTREETTEETKGKAPVFTVPLENIENLREGENAHFEARITPADDPKLKVEWYWNGRPLKAGSRFRTFCDFGFVILEISPVYPEDSGEYSCRAINEYGEAVTTATMKIQGKRSIIMESQLPKGMEGTIDRIAELEGLGSRSTEFVPDDDTGKPPEFITSPFDMVIGENALAHFECRLQPINDPSMRVDWFHNGKALWAGSRIKTINDFGFVILEIAGCYQRDSGLYTCKATNKHGEATVSCKLQVKGRQGIVMEPQLPSNFRTGTESLQKLEETMHKREELVTEDEQPNPPKFTEEIKDNLDVPEGGPIHFDCRVEPVGDPTMRIEWFYNGHVMATGSRVHQLNDFGFIALDVDYIYARDSGEYTCRATNKWGTATTSAKVTCKGKHNIVYESQLPEGMTSEKLKELERGRIPEAPKVVEEVFGPPKFTTQITSVTVDEAEAVRFECQVEPKTDPSLRVEWYRNGKPLPSGHRYRNIFDMGFVSLDILYVYGEDSGEYVCRAINNHGEDRTRATVSCKKLPTILLQNQVPRGMKRSDALTQMEATIKKYTSEVHLTEDDLFDPDRKQPPRFVTQIKEQLTLTEMAVTKFECQLAPVGDPNMKVEWFFNGKPLLHKNRFQPIYDFGYVAMNFGWVYPEDSGEYVCRATNLYGKDETRAIIKVSGKPGIVYDSQLPAHMQSIDRIREMEASWQVVPDEVDPDAKPRTKPVFVSKLEPQTVEEGDPARFCVRVTGHPRPRVMWLINGHTVVHGSRYKLTNDGMFHLDVPKTRQYDTGKVEVIARNSVGESIATTELKVVARSDDYRNVLKNSPRPWYDYELAAYQKERQENELEKVFDERKQVLSEQSSHTLKGVEHLKPKQYKPPTPDWQQNVKAKKSEDYYNKLQTLETEQLLKETNLRRDTHQYAIPGEKVVSSSQAKGMAQSYEENLQEKTSTTQVLAAPPKGTAQPSESSVHGREVHMNKQQQVQKEIQGDLEITRKITATETTEVEHKGTIQERVVQGPVKPAKAPVFTKKIQPCRVFENEQAKFEVEFEGEPNPTVKWYRESFPIQNSPDLQIHTFSGKSILIIRQVFVEDSAVFSCVAENRGGTAKCSANLVVEERRRAGKGGIQPPSFVTTIQSTTVATGQLARFDAKVTGTRPLDVYWLKNGMKIQPSIKFKMLEEDSVHTLLIIEPFAEDSGRYECVAVNAAGEARCDGDCIVQSPSKPEKPTTPGSEKAPHIVEQLKSQSVEEGSKVIFRCRVDGKPTPTARWMRGENFVKPSRYFQMSRQGEYYQLVISEAFPEDEGTYKCVAENKLGSIQTSAQLKVRPIENLDAPPTITALKDVSVTEGMPAQFKTTVTGKVKATSVQWFREGQLIPETPDFQMIFDGNSAVLLIGTTYEEDSGIFTVRVTSSTGQVESSAKLTVKKRRISAFQLRTIDSAEDESSSSGREDSAPESPHAFQPGQQPGQQFGQFLGVNGQGQHQGRSRQKKPKVRSKSLQPATKVIPWRKSSRPTRGRSLDKGVFLPGFKPEPVKSWTEETISLKATPIEKKKPAPKLEAAKVVLKSIKTERDQGIMSLGATLEQIIAGKTEKEAIPWITMREKLKAVESVQQQLNKFDLDEVYLQPLEGQIETEGQLPQQAQVEQVQRTKEIQRLKSMESVEIMEMTDQIDKLITQQQNAKDLIPWKEMRQQLKSVQRVTKQIDKFKIEEVELRHLQAQQAITEEYQTGTAEETVVMIDESSKGSISKVIRSDDLLQYEDQSNIYKQKFVTTEDVNIMHVSEREKLEAQRLLREQQAVNWRQQQQRPQLQPLTSVEDTVISQTTERQKLVQQQSFIEEAQRQQFVQVEDSQMMSLEQYEHQKIINQRTQQEAFSWRQPREPQKFIQVEDSSLLHLQERHDTQEQQLLQQEPVMWDRGRKKPDQPQYVQPQEQRVKEEYVEKPKTYEEMHDELVEPTPIEQPQPVPVMWERGKKKPQPQEKTFEEAHDELVEPTPVQQPEPVPVMWERGKKKAAQQETVLSQEVVQTSQVVEQQIVEETKKTAVRRVIPPREPEQKVEQVTLKPTPRPRPKEALKAEEIQLKPFRSTRPVPQPVEAEQKAYEEATDELPEEPLAPLQDQPQPVMWERGKKKPQKPQEEVSEIPKTLEISVDALEEEVPKPTEPQPQPVLWARGQKKPQKPDEQKPELPKSLEIAVDTIEEDLIKPVQPEPQPVLWERGKKKKPHPQDVIEEKLDAAPTKTYEEAVDVLPDEPKVEEKPEPVLWQRGKKKIPKSEPTEEVHPDEVDAQIETVVKEDEVIVEEKRRIKKTKKPKSTKEVTEELFEEQPEEEISPEEEVPQKEVIEEIEEIVEEKRRLKKTKKPKLTQQVTEEEKPDEVVIEESEEVVQEQEEIVEEKKKVKKVKKPKTVAEKQLEEDEIPAEETVEEEETAEDQQLVVEESKKVKKVKKPTRKVEKTDVEELPAEEVPAEEVIVEEVPEEVAPEEEPIEEQEEIVDQDNIQEQKRKVKKAKKPKKTIEKNEIEREEDQPEEEVPQEEIIEEQEEITERQRRLKTIKKPKKIVTEQTVEQAEQTEKPEESQAEEVKETVTEEPKKPKPAPEEAKVEQIEKISLKPAPRKQRLLPEKEQVEEVLLKPLKKIAAVSEAEQPETPETEFEVKEFAITTTEDIVDVTKKRVKKKKPKTKVATEESTEEPAEETEEFEEDEAQPEEVQPVEEIPEQPQVEEVADERKTAPKPKPRKEEIIEKVEEVALKRVTRPKKELPQEATIEEVRLKPTQRTSIKPEEVKLEEVDLQHVEKKEDEIVQEEKRKTRKVKKPKHEDLPEIPDAEPTQLEEAEHIELEKQPKPEEAQPQVPWKRGEKKQPVEEVLEEKKWPSGKRRPLPEQQPEEVQLKPIPSKPIEEPQKPEKAIPGPQLVPEEKPESEEEELELEPLKLPEDKQPKEPKAKKEKKKKPKLKKATPSVDEVSEEVAEPFDEPIAEEDEVEEMPVDDDKVVAVSEDVLPEEEVVPTEETPEAKQKAHKKRTKRLKEASVEDQPQLLEAAIAEIEKVDEISQEISQKTITLLKKTEDTRPQFITTEQLIELDVEDVRRDLEMKVTSNIIKKEKRRVVLDDSQPLPELELITQKRIQEGIDKVADEELIEDQQLTQNQQETTTSEVIGQERKLVKKKKKEIKPPRITEKLRPRQCVPEEPTVLECKVEGVPFPEIKWYFNDILLFASEKYEITVIEQVAKLKIAKVTPSDVGVYTCEAKNEAGVATSRTNIILEKEQGVPPQFTKPLKIEFTEEKQPERLKVTVTCQVTGKPNPQVKWYRGIEEVIPSETVQMFYDEKTGDVALEVINPTPNEAVVYSVQAQNQFGRAIGNANILSRVDEVPREILKAPTVTPLSAVVVPTGGTLFFQAKYDGLPRPEVKWMRNGREIIENEETIIETTETTTTIKVVNMTRKRTGKYEVWAKNKVGEAKSSGSVVVSDQKPDEQIKPPRFIQPLEPKYFGEHEVAIIEAIVESEPLSSFQWYVHNEPIKSSNEVRIVSQANKSTLLIEDFQSKFVGPFTCRAENVGGSVTSTATVNLIESLPQEEAEEFESPRFVEELVQPVEVMDGEALLLTCQVTGKPTPKVEWYHNAEKITENKETTISQDLQGVCQLQITEVFPENEGQYECVATNKIGKSVSKTNVKIQAFEYIPDSEITGLTGSEEDLLDRTLSIDEQAPKIIKKLPEKIEPKEGEQAKLEVKVVGKPKPKVKWLRDDEQIFASEEYQIENFEDGTSVLVINHVYPDDLGTISFEAYNPLGVAVTTALFAVEVKFFFRCLELRYLIFPKLSRVQSLLTSPKPP